MGELVLQHPTQLRRDRREALNRNAQFPVIDRTGPKRRLSEVLESLLSVKENDDGLGRLKSVCEITSGTGSGTCGQTSSATGYWTQYTFDTLNKLSGVTQNSQQTGQTQTRFYGYDGIAPTGCSPTLASANLIRRRTGMCDAAGWEAWSYEIVPSVGWKTTDRRTTNGVTKDFVYQNNLVGSVATLTYPTSPSRSISYDYNADAAHSRRQTRRAASTTP